MAKAIYYTGLSLGSDEQKLRGVYENVKNIDAQIECGNLHNGYFQLMNLNVILPTRDSWM